VYDADEHLIAEVDGAGTTLVEYIWLGDTPVAVLRNGVLYYVYTDHLNAPRAVTDTANTIRWTWYSEPFGSSLPNENPSGVAAFKLNLRFPGQYYDVESGLHYNYFRYYDPQTGRYVQSDPIGIKGGINTYGYVGSNPMNGIDPLGLDCTSANGQFSCSTPGGPSFGPLPAPPGFPESISSRDHTYHYYAKVTPAGNCTRADLWPKLATGPIPWRPNAASESGTLNNATPPGFQAAISFGKPYPGPMNLVKSYITMDHNSGKPMVVNVTLPGHVLFPGYTARVIDDSIPGASAMITYGEGLGDWQSDRDSPKIIRDAINDVWYDNQEKIVRSCGCQ
jgi:RHS repeat-associated protein